MKETKLHVNWFCDERGLTVEQTDLFMSTPEVFIRNWWGQ